jgi:hypothetical protein
VNLNIRPINKKYFAGKDGVTKPGLLGSDKKMFLLLLTNLKVAK